MSKHEFDRFFDRLESLSVGFGPIFRNFQTVTTGYPPHNIVRHSETLFVLELAVAGFKKDEISIQELNGELLIKGIKSQPTADVADQYQYRGIGQRSFEKAFKLAEYIEIIDAKLEHGMLTLTLVRNEPDANKPKLITIK